MILSCNKILYHHNKNPYKRFILAAPVLLGAFLHLTNQLHEYIYTRIK